VDYIRKKNDLFVALLKDTIMDYLGIGYAYLFGGIAISVAIVFFLLEILLKLFERSKNFWNKVILAAGIVIVLLILVYMANFCIYSVGLPAIQYGKNLDQQNQKIVFNISCSNDNCTTTMPNDLEISCPVTNITTQQSVCPTQIPCPLVTPSPPKVYRCPWSLALP